MTIDLIKFGFVGGEISERYHGRPDLEKFDLALAIAENFQVAYQGGLDNCPGTQYIDFLRDSANSHRFYSFVFSNNIANTNLVIFGHEFINFVQNGAYVLEDEKTVTSITRADPAVVVCTAHGFATGDWIQFPSYGSWPRLAGRSLVVTYINANRFSLSDPFGESINTVDLDVISGTLSCARIYTVVSPYQSADLDKLNFATARDYIRITHIDYPIHNLIRNDQADWTLEEELTYSTLALPSGLAHTSINTGNHNTAYTVTWVNEFEEESLPAEYHYVTNCADIENTADSAIQLRWTPVPGSKYYNVYRSRIIYNDPLLSRALETGYVGRTKGAYFVDSGIIPDFAKTPPRGNNPFADGEITQIDVVDPGSGFNNSDVLTVTDPNPGASGFLGYPLVQYSHPSSTGPIGGVQIISGGQDYTAPVVTLGAATFDVTLGPATGNNPATCTIYQQRQVYAATENSPLTIYGSRSGQLSNFNESNILVADDAYEHEVDSESRSRLRHILGARGGILGFSGEYIWLITGSNGNITATDVQADIQVNQGASFLQPLRVSTEIIYCDPTGTSVQALNWVEKYRVYTPTEISVLAEHLFPAGSRISDWAYAFAPHRLVHAIRDDGIMLLLTMMKEQEVYAWTRRTTQGRFINIAAFNEQNRAAVYVSVEREFPSGSMKCLEKIMQRNDTMLDDAKFLDAALYLENTSPEATITVAAASGENVLVTSLTNIFTVADVDKILRGGGGKGRVVSFTSPKEIHINIINSFTDLSYLSSPPVPRKLFFRDWTLDAEVASIGGLHHFNGMEVTVVADGGVYHDMLVTDGQITLPQAASRVIVGLRYVSIAKALPLTINGAVVEGKRKRITKLAMRLFNTKGLKCGSSMDRLYSIRVEASSQYGETAGLANGMTHLAIDPVWAEDGDSYFVQEDPLPVGILGYVATSEIGDDDD